jgi:hypothetical protein
MLKWDLEINFYKIDIFLVEYFFFIKIITNFIIYI